MTFGDKTFDKPRKIANQLNAQYTPAADIKPTKSLRSLCRNLQSPPPAEESFIFHVNELQEILKATKNSKSTGPDGLSPLMLKHLGPRALAYITNLFNHVINTAIIPPMWKTGRIVPLLKPHKPADVGKSYRPVSLLSPLAKALESLLLPKILASITFADHQHGFRKKRSTTTALQDIIEYIKHGLNKNKPVDRTVLVAVDLTCAFDTVSHEILLKDISNLPLNPFIKRFLAGYLRGRKTFVEFRNTRSKCRQMRQGVPQGGVLSPILFNLYMSHIPPPPPGIKITSYADDCSIASSGPKILPICKKINGYLDTLNKFFLDRNLVISPAKSTATVFTTCTQDMGLSLPIKIGNTAVPTVRNPKILGTYLDPLLNFNAHSTYVRDRVAKRNNILKALAGTTWGMDKEVILSTYKAIGRSIYSYCAPIWTPSLCNTRWTELQVPQSAALRTALGCTKMTDLGHLHSECKFLTVEQHNKMLAKQFYLSTKQTGHANFSIPYQPPSRIMKQSLATLYEDEIQGLYTQNGNNAAQHKIGLRAIHTEAVAASIATAPPNKVLQLPAPEISQSESNLPRSARSTLSQLRSGYSSSLMQYLNRIKPNIYDPHCPRCGIAPHDTPHLFNCPANPTSLNTLDLWSNPEAVADFLDLVPRADEGGDGRQDDPG